jgi:hypothetical protein
VRHCQDTALSWGVLTDHREKNGTYKTGPSKMCNRAGAGPLGGQNSVPRKSKNKSGLRAVVGIALCSGDWP